MPEHNHQPTSVKTIFLETFGCQMNDLDSELISGQLTSIGYELMDDRDSADIVLFNTCSVREQAENKVLSRIGELGVEKREGRKVIVGMIGCLPEREGSSLLGKYPQIDFLCGPSELDKLPMLVNNAIVGFFGMNTGRVALQGNNSRRSAALSAAEDNLELLDLSRAFDPDGGNRSSAFVRITQGCNKFCTYCVVPNTRGAEVHRPPDVIVQECRELAESGVVEVTLLGQTVNHYRYTHGMAISHDGREVSQVGPSLKVFSQDDTDNQQVTTFAKLLRRIHDEVPEIARLRFVTSYPKDFGDDILETMRDCDRICNYLHVPAQSGSNRILKLMNRGYTVEEYLEFIDRAKTIIPDVEIAGDIIVGFPTETEDDYEATRTLLKKVRYKNNFVFHYSPRPGTVAIDRFEDDISRDVKRRRLNAILELGGEISSEVHGSYEGKEVEIFVERVSPKSSKRNSVELRWETQEVQMTGRTAGDLICVFNIPEQTDPEKYIGKKVVVSITESGPLLLSGTFCGFSCQ
ncbi:radical SAM protein [PVC group bacterium]|nr:radical SAM protein [PVC group bacterium]